MPSHDSKHFNQYTEENQIKHRILGEYLPAYLTALKNRVDRFHYIDGFAGRGFYEEDIPGSPLRVMDILADQQLLNRTSFSLVEDRSDFFGNLQQVLSDHPLVPQVFDPPLVRQGRFDAHIDEILTRSTYKEPGKVATFAFIDPCGVDGIRMQDITRLLQQQFGEALLFFNYDGVNRIVGGAEKGVHDINILSELFGSEDIANSLITDLRTCRQRIEREKLIRERFISALLQNGIKYVLPFRFGSKLSDRTSHYLVHLSNHCLAFKLIKHVMWEAGRGENEKYGKLEFVATSMKSGQIQLLRPDIDLKKREILDDLSRSNAKVKDYILNQICKPSDIYPEGVYKKMLLELEQDGKIVIYDKTNKIPTPAEKRRKLKGQATLGDGYWIRACNDCEHTGHSP